MRADADRLRDIETAARMAIGIPVTELMDVTGERSRAAQKLLEIVGEAMKNLSEGLRSSLPHVDFAGPARMRDRLSHRYFDVDGSEICETVSNDLPRLLAQFRLVRLSGQIPPRS